MKIFYVYGHFRFGKVLPFYIGKGCKFRAYSLSKRNRYHKAILNKYKYKVRILKHFENEQDAFNFEKLLILLFKKVGACEVNFHPGGTGGDTFSKLPEEEKIKFRNKMSIIVSLRPIKCLKPLKGNQHPNYGKPGYFRGFSKESIAKIRSSKIGIKNPMFGRTGKNHPKFKGWYVTPAGTFESSKEANKANNTQYSKYYCKISKSEKFKSWYFIENKDSK